MGEPVVTFAVPRRADGGRRDQLWTFCRQWWTDRFPEWKIREGESPDGPFNRGAAINQAAAADWDVLVIIDSDVIADETQVADAVKNTVDTGRATLAYDRYVAVNDQVTNQILEGYDGNWSARPALTMATHISSIVVVPRDLWDDVGGFDERFVGWGYDDLAFIEACRVLGGGIDRIPGTVYHLHHPHTTERKRNPQLAANGLLAGRYHQATEPAQMRALVAERTDNGVCLIVLTDGRRDCISKTIPSAEQRLKGLPVVKRIICDDSADIEYAAWLRITFPGWQIVTTQRRRGFGGNVRTAWTKAIEAGQPYVFWLEDDFLFDRDVDLDAIANVLDANPHVLQMALRRQAWFPKEVAAGGVIEQHPDQYDDRTDGQHRWLEHDLFWTTNPHLVSRQTLIDYEWPKGANSEAAFAKQALRDGRKSGYWEPRTARPLVTHMGERQGTGY